MAKIRHDAMTDRDLEDYLDTEGDFAFEMSTIHAMKSLPFKCEHGGTYKDSVTGISRQFDIRAHTRAGASWLYLAIECKNVRENFPLLVSCVPRHGNESRHNVLITFPPDMWPQQMMDPLEVDCLVTSIDSGGDDPYRSRGLVGKACAQVGKSGDNEFQVVGKDIYERWSQSLSSAHELVTTAAASHSSNGLRYSVVVPFVVVPDGRLWHVAYDDEGKRTESPVQANRVSYYVDHAVPLGPDCNFQEYRISHVEFVTQEGLIEFVKWMSDENGRGCFTPEVTLQSRFEQRRATADREAARDRINAVPGLPHIGIPDLGDTLRKLKRP